MSIKKTKSMVVGGEGHDIEVRDGCVEDVDHFPYLGVTMQANGSMDKELSLRMGKARAAFARLWKNVWGGEAT